jgi:hypothetical protein
MRHFVEQLDLHRKMFGEWLELEQLVLPQKSRSKMTRQPTVEADGGII